MSTANKTGGTGGCDCNSGTGASAPVGDSGGLHPGGGGSVNGYNGGGNAGPGCQGFDQIANQIKNALKSQCGFNDDCAQAMAEQAAKKVCDAIKNAAEDAMVPDVHKDPVTGEQKPGCEFKAFINGPVKVNGKCNKRTGKPENVITEVPDIDISHNCNDGPTYPDPNPPDFENPDNDQPPPPL